MDLFKFKGYLAVLSMLLEAISCDETDYCTKLRTPFHSNFQPLSPDDRFAIEIEGVTDEYMPGQTYNVKLSSLDGKSEFVAFTISATGTLKKDPSNPRKDIWLQAGEITSVSEATDGETIKLLDPCKNTVVEANKQPKTKVVATWKAPAKGNVCVTIWAYVGVKPDVWYTNTGPLTKRVCEDVRQKADMKPRESRYCRVCQDARYELEFQGTWSLNTHMNMYPNNSTKIVRFSDIVGASHGKGFVLYDEQSVASQGLKMLAEQGNTTLMERDILKDLPSKVRTVIKANGPYNSTSSTMTGFRTSRDKHFISLAASVIPSSDWFVGVIDMELCDDDKWLTNYVYNLYPMDAGTDSGEGFESAPEPTTPPQPIRKVNHAQGPEKPKPFAQLTIRLVRVYDKDCGQMKITDTTPTEDGDVDISYQTESPVTSRPGLRPTTFISFTPEGQTPDVVTEPEITGCETTDFESYQACEGDCTDNKRFGYRMRQRSFIDKEASAKCDTSLLFEVELCEEECEDNTTETDPQARQGDEQNWIKPGQPW